MGIIKRREVMLLKNAKPCPFCGNTKIEVIPQKENYEWLIKCTVCGIKKFVYTAYKRQLLVEWNRRYKDGCS
jgi:Lar family restriction alleviation protein